MGKIPGIGDIPILGLPVPRKATRRIETELVVDHHADHRPPRSAQRLRGPPLAGGPTSPPRPALSESDAYTGSPRYPADRPKPNEGDGPAAPPCRAPGLDAGPAAAPPNPRPPRPGAVAPGDPGSARVDETPAVVPPRSRRRRRRAEPREASGAPSAPAAKPAKPAAGARRQPLGADAMKTERQGRRARDGTRTKQELEAADRRSEAAERHSARPRSRSRRPIASRGRGRRNRRRPTSSPRSTPSAKPTARGYAELARSRPGRREARRRWPKRRRASTAQSASQPNREDQGGDELAPEDQHDAEEPLHEGELVESVSKPCITYRVAAELPGTSATAPIWSRRSSRATC